MKDRPYPSTRMGDAISSHKKKSEMKNYTSHPSFNLLGGPDRSEHVRLSQRMRYLFQTEPSIRQNPADQTVSHVVSTFVDHCLNLLPFTSSMLAHTS